MIFRNMRLCLEGLQGRFWTIVGSMLETCWTNCWIICGVILEVCFSKIMLFYPCGSSFSNVNIYLLFVYVFGGHLKIAVLHERELVFQILLQSGLQ